jgi:meso-butanediol dehydrogenase/(S,S)-butanediol dehydrogenase/diacetyl reductase
MSEHGRFDGRVAVIIGATSGIGLATARRFHEEGADVVIAARRDAEGTAAAAALGSRAAFHRTNITERADLEDLFAATAGRLGRIDVLVNCAGISVAAPTMSVQPKHWRRTMDVNLNGLFEACQAAIPYLRATIAAGLAPQTAIVNVTSIDASAAGRGMAAYNAAKAGALNFTRSLALEFVAEGIRVNAVSPGAIDTAMAGAVTASADALAVFAAAIPAGRLGRPDEVAAVIAFAASDEASFMIGANLAIDGGVSAGTGHPDVVRLFNLE